MPVQAQICTLDFTFNFTLDLLDSYIDEDLQKITKLALL